MLYLCRLAWRRFRWSGADGELVALQTLLVLLALCSVPWRFCSVHYEYIPAEALATQLLALHQSAAAPAMCPLPTTLPSPVPIDASPVSDSELEALPVGPPTNCSARYRVAVVVPYRARAHQLRVLLRHLHPFLRAQQLDYHIYVVEQSHRFPFNRGKLLNIGFKEAVAETGVDCIIFHDVDLLPEDLGNVYACSRRPRHLAARVSSMRYQLQYPSLSGGVLAITDAIFRAVNGYSNLYFGWGAEDDDLSARLTAGGWRLTRPDPRVSRYTMLQHAREAPSGDRYHLLSGAPGRAAVDGLSSLRYTVLAREQRRTHRWISVEV